MLYMALSLVQLPKLGGFRHSIHTYHPSPTIFLPLLQDDISQLSAKYMRRRAKEM